MKTLKRSKPDEQSWKVKCESADFVASEYKWINSRAKQVWLGAYWRIASQIQSFPLVLGLFDTSFGQFEQSRTTVITTALFMYKRL